MSDKDYNVHQGSDDVWRGRRQGNSRASVAGSTQAEVFEKTRELAKKTGGDASIHRADNNRIRDKHSYGNDPESSKG